MTITVIATDDQQLAARTLVVDGEDVPLWEALREAASVREVSGEEVRALLRGVSTESPDGRIRPSDEEDVEGGVRDVDEVTQRDAQARFFAIPREDCPVLAQKASPRPHLVR